MSISVINEVCVVSRSATWALKLALFAELWALSVSQAPYIRGAGGQHLFASKKYISLLGFCHCQKFTLLTCNSVFALISRERFVFIVPPGFCRGSVVPEHRQSKNIT